MIDTSSICESTSFCRQDNDSKMAEYKVNHGGKIPAYIEEAYDALPEIFEDAFDEQNAGVYKEVIGPEPALDPSTSSKLYKSLQTQTDWRKQYLKLRQKMWNKKIKTRYDNLSVDTTDDTNDESMRQLIQIASNTLQTRIQNNEISNEDLVKLITALSPKKGQKGGGPGGFGFSFNIPPKDIKDV